MITEHNENLKVGQKVAGKVKNIKPYGAFVDIGNGKVGLVHIKDLSVARIKTPYERLKIGQNIDVVVKYIDKEQDRILLSYKEMLGTWEENAEKFTQGIKVKGKIRETEKIKRNIYRTYTKLSRNGRISRRLSIWSRCRCVHQKNW